MSIPGLFITGTDTGVGKTRVASAIVRDLVASGRGVGAMKPVATSATRSADGSWASPDAMMLQEALGAEAPPGRIAPILYPGDLAPSAAMRRAGAMRSKAEVLRATRDGVAWWASRCEVLVVEGIGGWLCPLTDDSTVADLASILDFPVVVVARKGLGTLNHTLLTVESIRLRGLRVAGVILNGSEPTTNPEAEATNPGELARHLGGVPILAVVPHSPEAETLSGAMHGVDWWGRAAPPRGESF